MPEAADDAGKLKLGENHRRVVSVLLRGVEQMCNAIGGWMEKEPGILLRLENDLSVEQRRQVGELVAELRAEIRRLDQEIDLQPAVESPHRAIRALLSAMTVEIEERKSPRLDGYGPLPEATRVKLDETLDRLLVLLQAMTDVVK